VGIFTEYIDLVELFKHTKINERFPLLDIIFGEIKKQSIDSVSLTLDLHVKSLDPKDLPSIASILSPDELKAIRDDQKQLEKILFPKKEAGFNSLEEFLRNKNIIERVQLLDIILGKDSREILMARGLPKPKSLDDLSPVIELYHHTVRAGGYPDAYNLLIERLVPNPLHFQFGAYSTIIELDNALFEDPPTCEKCKIERLSTQAWLYNSLANSYSLSGQPRRAVPLFGMACDIWEKVDDKKNLTIGLGNLAIVGQIPIADLESVESNLRRYSKLSIELGIEGENADAYIELGRLLTYRGEFKESKSTLTKALRLEEKEGHSEGQGTVWSYRSLRALLMDEPKEALEAAKKAIEMAIEWQKITGRANPNPRDLIQANWLIGASYVAMGDAKSAEAPLNYAITECRKINLVELEAAILLEMAKLEYLKVKPQMNADERRLENIGVYLRSSAVKLAEEALEIATRCDYVLQQADIEEFLCEYYLAIDDKKTAKEHLDKCLECCTHCWRYSEKEPDFDYIKKEDKFYYIKKKKKWWYKPRYDSAMKLLDQLNSTQ